jgi:ketosteroid isomerase-like protein
MSQENVETVCRAYEAFSRGGLDALLEHFHADIEYDATAAIGPFAGMYYGRAAVRNFLADYFESWEYVRMEPEEFIEVGENHVVVPLRLHTRGKGSGIEVQAQTINVWTMRDGDVVRLAIHNDRGRALEAAGMSEQNAHTDS